MLFSLPFPSNGCAGLRVGRRVGFGVFGCGLVVMRVFFLQWRFLRLKRQYVLGCAESCYGFGERGRGAGAGELGSSCVVCVCDSGLNVAAVGYSNQRSLMLGCVYVMHAWNVYVHACGYYIVSCFSLLSDFFFFFLFVSLFSSFLYVFSSCLTLLTVYHFLVEKTCVCVLLIIKSYVPRSSNSNFQSFFFSFPLSRGASQVSYRLWLAYFFAETSGGLDRVGCCYKMCMTVSFSVLSSRANRCRATLCAVYKPRVRYDLVWIMLPLACSCEGLLCRI